METNKWITKIYDATTPYARCVFINNDKPSDNDVNIWLLEAGQRFSIERWETYQDVK